MATSEPLPTVEPVVTAEELKAARRIVNRVYVDDKIRDYIVDIVAAHGSAVDVMSAPGAGSTFTSKLPGGA